MLKWETKTKKLKAKKCKKQTILYRREVNEFLGYSWYNAPFLTPSS